MYLILSCSCLCSIHWSQVLSREWRCSWSSADIGDAPTTSELSTILLPTKVRLILEVLRYMEVLYFTSGMEWYTLTKTVYSFYIWVRLWKYGCLVTWFCYLLKQVTRQPHLRDLTHIYLIHDELNTKGAKTKWTSFRRRHFQTFFNENVCILFQISLKFVPNGPIHISQHWLR